MEADEMIAGNRYKIDVNVYTSKHFPVALYREEKRFFGLFPCWDHIESFQTVADAEAHYNAFKAGVVGVPKMLT